MTIVQTENEQSIYINTNKNVLKLEQEVDLGLKNFYSYLDDKNINPHVNYKKIEYRNIEHQKLYTINKILDILYYCFYFSFVIIIIFTKNLGREHFLTYLFIGLIPIIYPFLFKFIKIFINYFSNLSHGPKNAFIDINNTIYGSSDYAKNIGHDIQYDI